MAMARLRFWKDRFIWTSAMHRGGRTSRPSVAILAGAPGGLRVGHAGGLVQGQVIAVNAAVERTIEADRGFYSLNLDPIHPLCRLLREQLFADQGVLDLTTGLSPSLQHRLDAEVLQGEDCAASWQLSEDLLQALFPTLADPPPLDARVLKAARWIREELPQRSCLPQLSALCALSESRLSHLFRQEMGVPIKSYVLAMKMRQAAQWFGQNRSLTEIAHMMGFSDSPHLTKAFQAYFSVPPSLLTDRRLVEVCNCEQT